MTSQLRSCFYSNESRIQLLLSLLCQWTLCEYFKSAFKLHYFVRFTLWLAFQTCLQKFVMHVIVVWLTAVMKIFHFCHVVRQKIVMFCLKCFSLHQQTHLSIQRWVPGVGQTRGTPMVALHGGTTASEWTTDERQWSEPARACPFLWWTPYQGMGQHQIHQRVPRLDFVLHRYDSNHQIVIFIMLFFILN